MKRCIPVFLLFLPGLLWAQAPADRENALLKGFGLNDAQIAQVLDIPVGTVMSRLSRGKDILRHRIASRRASDVGPKTNIISPNQFIRSEGLV